MTGFSFLGTVILSHDLCVITDMRCKNSSTLRDYFWLGLMIFHGGVTRFLYQMYKMFFLLLTDKGIVFLSRSGSRTDVQNGGKGKRRGSSHTLWAYTILEPPLLHSPYVITWVGILLSQTRIQLLIQLGLPPSKDWLSHPQTLLPLTASALC